MTATGASMIKMLRTATTSTGASSNGIDHYTKSTTTTATLPSRTIKRRFVEPLAFCLGMITVWLFNGIRQRPEGFASLFSIMRHNDLLLLQDNRPVIYGHLHVAQTAGSNINGALAAKYERVCGSKGYSYDAYQFNLRVQQQYNKSYYHQYNTSYHPKQHNAQQLELPLITESGDSKDLIRKAYPGGGWNRGNVPLAVMDDIGYENCDYISLEMDWRGWNTRFNDVEWNLELHVPCRDPLDHLMALCRQQQVRFDCHAPNLSDEVQKCLGGNVSSSLWSPSTVTNRFHANLNNRFVMKCFDPIPVNSYLECMGERLQPKERPATYMYRSTTPKKHRVQECIWDDSQTAVKVRRLLLDMPYYQWCRECLADSNRNLLYSTTHTGKNKSKRAYLKFG